MRGRNFGGTNLGGNKVWTCQKSTFPKITKFPASWVKEIYQIFLKGNMVISADIFAFLSEIFRVLLGI